MSTDRGQATIGGTEVTVVRKDIKNLHLGVYPPDGHVRIAVPLSVTDEAVRAAVSSRLAWIRRQQALYRRQARETAREMVSGETHWYAGRRYRLRVVYGPGRPRITLTNRTTMEMRCPPGTSTAGRQHILDLWYRRQLSVAIPALLDAWCARVGVERPAWGLRRMKTKWGSYSEGTGRVWFNTELAKKPPRALEYVVVHELTHVAVRRHSDRFLGLLDAQLPHWRLVKAELGALPLGHEDWRT
ncbi:MAG: SprT family zinc-dependent metalloprotease [Chloroflexota bacterium]